MERLASFCAVADAGSIVKVAGGDPVRQSLISRQIRELEIFFGAELVRRKGRGLELTASGRELAAVGRENFKGLSDFAARCQEAPWRARLVASNSVAYWHLLPKLHLLGEAAEKVRFSVFHEQTHDMVNMIREGTYDLAFVHEEAIDAGFSRIVLGTVGHTLLVPKTLVTKAPPDLETALSQIPLAIPLGGKMRSLLDQLAGQGGFPLDILVSCSSYLQASQILVQGSLAAVLPDLALPTLDLSLYHCFEVPYSYQLCLAWIGRNADTRPALLRLIGELGAVAKIPPRSAKSGASETRK
jgi:DNA-binding transcriptional LysR family regulator